MVLEFGVSLGSALAALIIGAILCIIANRIAIEGIINAVLYVIGAILVIIGIILLILWIVGVIV